MASTLPKWTSRLRDNIKGSMFRYTLEDDYKFFITHEDLISAWNEGTDNETPLKSLRQDVDYFSSISDDGFNESWIRVISVLIWIQHDSWLEFLQSSLNLKWDKPRSKSEMNSTSNTPKQSLAAFRDEHLPFTKDELERYLFKDVETAINFFEAQFAFKPICLQQNELLSFDDERYRLPIKQEDDVNDTGAYGLVAKVRVAGNHYLYKTDISPDLEPYPNDFDAARKQFDVDYDFAREHENLKLLRSTDIQHSRIMQSFTSVIIGRKYNLFFPWADLDLERFLYGEYLRDCDEDSITPYAIMREALEVLDALKFLHEFVQVNGTDVVFSHLDLKPNNILVVKDNDSSRYPLGKWKITDFGISGTQPRREDNSRLVSTRELMVRSTRPDSRRGSLVEIERYPGPYQPPEAEESIAELFKRTNIRTPGDKSDIWSYGCVLLNMLTFAIGGPRYSKIFDERRLEGNTCPDGKLRKGYFYRATGNEQFEVSHHIRTWFEEDLTENEACLMDIWKIVVDKMLRIYPYERSSAKEISTMLKPLIDEHLPRTNIWSEASDAPRKSISRETQKPTQIASESNQIISQHTLNPPTRPATETAQEATPENLPPEPAPGSPPPSNPTSPPASLPQFSKGKIVELDIAHANSVKFSSDGTKILYQTSRGAVAFRATEENGITTFIRQKTKVLPKSGQAVWSQVDVSGNYIALRKATSGRDKGKLEVHNLSDNHIHEQAGWMNRVENELINGICVSVQGHLAVRYSKSMSLFTSSGEPIHGKCCDTIASLRDGVKDIAFDGSGQILIVVSSNHWLMKDLRDDDSDPILAKHEFRRPDHGSFSPSIIPFTGTTSFVLHDGADPSRCLAILPISDTQSQFQECRFDLTESPDALAITPDNRKLIYVTTSRKHRFSRRYTYSLRARSIEVGANNPVGASDLWETAMFELNEKLDVSIAAVSTSTGSMVLVAVANGVIYGFTAE